MQFYPSVTNSKLKNLKKKLELINHSYSDSLGASLWFYDENQIRTQLQGIMNIDQVLFARITDNLNLDIENGQRPHASQLATIELHFNQRKIGTLEIAFDTDSVTQHAIQAAINILSAQLTSLLLLALVLGVMVHQLINKRLANLALVVDQHRQSNSYTPLNIELSKYHDEIDTLSEAFNALSAQTNEELQQKNHAQQQLKVINLELEDRVQKRTQDLQNTVNELNNTLEQLHTTQRKLIEADKLSSLGGMVAGVAHEINTPLGLCITVQSYMYDNYQAVKNNFESGAIRKQDFEEYLAGLAESLSILDKNLQRAAQLIRSFKQISEDQIVEHIRKFSLLDYLQEILSTLSPKIKKTKHKIEVNCSPQLWMRTYAGAISQIFTNLILNSLVHAFEENEEGTIIISASEDRGNIVLIYQDNGKGLSEEAKQKVFEPFYTTKRGQGGTGLGMSLVYNITHQRLHGDIEVLDVEQGAAYRLTLPKITPESNSDASKL